MADGVVSILVVDDEPGLGNAIALYLEDLDYEATSMENAQAMLDCIVDHCVDIAIVDLSLPDMEGEDLICRAHEACPQLHFIIQTGRVNYQLSKKLLDLGIKQDQVLYKPFYRMSDLSEVVQRFSHK